jgi:hypothetical protein
VRTEVLDNEDTTFSKLRHSVDSDSIGIRFRTIKDKLGKPMSLSHAGIGTLCNNHLCHIGLSVCVCVYVFVCMCVCLKGEGFMCVWMCERRRAHLCASLCVNDISVTRYFGESEPNFVVQRGNSVTPCAVCLFVRPVIFSSFIDVDTYLRHRN